MNVETRLEESQKRFTLKPELNHYNIKAYQDKSIATWILSTDQFCRFMTTEGGIKTPTNCCANKKIENKQQRLVIVYT